jgi:hypothetical protein
MRKKYGNTYLEPFKGRNYDQIKKLDLKIEGNNEILNDVTYYKIDQQMKYMDYIMTKEITEPPSSILKTYNIRDNKKSVIQRRSSDFFSNAGK